ncbi:MAG: hypothetical protein ACRDX8_06295 [Acidimicrobiales bacterium]
MSPLTVRYRSELHKLSSNQELLFGRDARCGLQIGSGDRGVSRLAGSVKMADGVWWLANLSSSRALHVVDDTQFATPLPVVGRDHVPSRRAVFAPGVTVLLAGEVWTYTLVFETGAKPTEATQHLEPLASTTTASQPLLTDRRKEALVAVLSGYLQAVPRYSPRPLSYSDAGHLAVLPSSTVRRRMEVVRGLLADGGVGGLDGDDAPCRLAEWALATRMVAPSDLDWLNARANARRHGLAADTTDEEEG